MSTREKYKDQVTTMGMAASQANLLTLTSRLHDIEYKAQNIESQKIALATQKEELYQTYCDALDATKIQVAFRNENATSRYVDATFASVCTYSEDRVKQYTLRDAQTGKVIVDSEVYDMYMNQGFDNDKYSFAWAMMGMGDNGAWADGDKDAASVGIGTFQGGTSGEVEDLWLSEVEQTVFDNHANDLDTQVKSAYDNLTEVSNKDDATSDEKQEALQNFRDKFYSKYSNEIYNYMRLNKGDDKAHNSNLETGSYDDEYPNTLDTSKFNYYVHLFEQIEASGGCQEVDAQYTSGDEGAEWFNNMVTSGRVLIDVYNTNKKEWQETSVATSTNENYLQEVQDDKDLKKAEATYEYELDKVNKKDTKYDNDLSKLETERTAITTEMDSIKKVRDDNIDRTFGIFS